jgi:hypothetical protein
MAPKKNRKQVQETMLEEPRRRLSSPPGINWGGGTKTQEDQDEPESEEEQRSSILFTPEQLEVLFKMNRPDFGELVAALKRGSSKNAEFQPAKPGNFDGVHDRKVMDAWLVEMEDYIHATKVGR